MTELEKIEYAKSFIDKLANGINPLDDSPIPADDIANNVRLSRCFFYVSDILRQVIENGGVEQRKAVNPRKQEFSLTDEERARLHPSDTPVPVSIIASRMNEVIDPEKTKGISAATINNWLLSLQLLETVTVQGGKTRKLPTKSGDEMGIFSEERMGHYGKYVTVLFSAPAQQFIYDNVEALVESRRESKGSRKEKKGDHLAEFYARPWTAEHDRYLEDMLKENLSLSEIANTLKRDEEGVRARICELDIL